MAIFSLEDTFSDQQAVVASAASENVLDLRAAGTWVHATAPVIADLGVGYMVPLGIQITEDFDALTDLTIEVQVDGDSAFGSPKTVQSQTILLADLVAGKKTAFQYVPRGVDERYMRLNYVVNGTNPAQGKITAGIVCLEDSFGNR